MGAVLRNLPISQSIPHRGRMHLVDTITWVDTGAIQGEVTTKLREDGPYFSTAGFEQHWLIELCAQASAAIYQAAIANGGAASNEASHGYLISVRDFEMAESAPLKPGDELAIQAVFESVAEPLGQSRSEVYVGGVRIAQGQLSFLMGGRG